MLTLIQSNSMRVLEAQLSQRFAERGSGLEPDVVIVPSAGVARWLKYRLADRQGVCANVDFPYPAQFIWQLFGRLLPDVPTTSPFDRDIMAWRLYGLLGALGPGEDCQPLHRYLARSDTRGRMELARRIAGLFDQYLVYRPDWLQAWAQGQPIASAGTDGAWQAALWRALLEVSQAPGAAHPKEAFFATLASLDLVQSAELLPGRISLFAIPLLPPLYLEVFVRLARSMHVDWYVLNPCTEFWADIVAERELARLALVGGGAAAYRDVGHPLLASWGKQARDNLALITALAEDHVSDHEIYAEPAGDHLLARLQRSILSLRDFTPAAIAAGDRSLQIHSCHSLVRQLEVLHDQLLALFDALPDLQPSDVLVMTPDVDAAAPLVEAVFGAQPPERFLPYAVTGRSRPDDTPLLRAFDTLLTLPASRFEAAAVLDLLRIAAVARRFGLDDNDLVQVRDWMHEAGVRWGRDEQQRAELGLPAESRHTWAQGLSRLILGYALPGDGMELHAGLLPIDNVEGGQALPVGRLARFVSQLDALAADLRCARPMARWGVVLHGLIDAFFEPDESELPQIERLRSAIGRLADSAEQAALREHVPVDVLRDLLGEALADSAPGGVPTGAITFCGIGPLRALPYRVVCAIGLDDAAFPRNPSALEFDLMARRPRLGDRARRDDDRGNFLDALMAAGDVFYLSYIGRNQRDNAPLPPSVLVSELLDYLGRCLPGGREAVWQRLVTEHPLQPFSRRYFDGELFSYATEHLYAAQAADPAQRIAAAPLIDSPLPAAGDEWRRPDLDTLIRFFRHPVRFLLRERLRIELARAEEELSATEPFLLDGPAAWALDDRLLKMRLAGLDEQQRVAVALAGDELPHGEMGRVLLQARLGEVDRFAALVESLRPAAGLDPRSFEFELDGFIVSGTLSGLHAGGLFGYRLATCNAGDILTAWLRHLVLNHLDWLDVGRETQWLSRDVLTELPPVTDAGGHLAALLELYRQGLQQPLPFFGRSALALVLEDSDAKARTAWCGHERWPGENADPWHRLAYGGPVGAWPDGFERTAQAVLGPVREVCRQRKVARGLRDEV